MISQSSSCYSDSDSSESPIKDMWGNIVFGRYRIHQKLGNGSFGVIFQGEDLYSEEFVAIKLEPQRVRFSQLTHEAFVYQQLSDGVGIPKVLWFGKSNGKKMMVMEKLGRNLEDLMSEFTGGFSLKTVLMLVDQMLHRIEFVHSKGYLHRDIKPENFVMGTGQYGHILYLLDFGLSKKYFDDKTKMHIKLQDGKSMTGTARYASIHAHLGLEQSRRDDLEAIGYLVLYLLRGSLPWQGMQGENRKQKYESIMNRKLQLSIAELCQKLPRAFYVYFESIRYLKFEEKPDYGYLRSLFQTLFIQSGYQFDFEYDWLKGKDKLCCRNEDPSIN